uniref:Retrotransposon gag domain-containing protein n=1 Tax=Cajanus cajan TaxID=3821 RepID=A0A151QU22_CAJCA|nr:hypothetical protein KK1_045361 [Cajanus cajan]
MYRNGQLHSWNQFLQALENRFAPTAFDDPRGKLFKLTQSSSVTEYLTEFESLANRIDGLQPFLLLSCFISGLTLELRRDVIAHQPTSISQAVGFARLHEEKLHDRSHPFRPPQSHRWPPTSVSCTFSQPPPLSIPKPTPPLLPTPPPKTRFKQLTEAEMAEKREKGLCFNYDQKFSRNHRCPARFFLLIADEEDSPPQTSEHGSGTNSDFRTVEDLLDPGSGSAQLSLNVLLVLVRPS